MYYIFHHDKHQQYKRNYDDEKKKPLHSVKYDTKNFKKKLYCPGRVYVRCWFTTPRWGVTHFYQCLRLCSCGTKPQRSENHHFVMTSSWEPQCHRDIIMRTPRIMGKPKFSCSRGP